MTKKPRVNKTKPEILAQMKQEAKIQRMVALTKLMWPMIENQEKIYDAQTVFHAMAGYIELGLKVKEDELKVKNLLLDVEFAKEKDGLVKTSMVNLLGLLEVENAHDTMVLCRKLADMIGQYGASQFVKGPMSGIKVTDIVK